MEIDYDYTRRERITSEQEAIREEVLEVQRRLESTYDAHLNGMERFRKKQWGRDYKETMGVN